MTTTTRVASSSMATTTATTRVASVGRAGAAVVRRRSAGDGEHGVPESERQIERFWRLWTGSANCRALVTASARGAWPRDAAFVESRVRALVRVFDLESTGVDVAVVCAREPRVLTLTAEDATRAVVRLKRAVPEITGRVLNLAPGLLLCDVDAVRAARVALEGEYGAVEAKRRVRESPDVLLDMLNFFDDDGRHGDEKTRQYTRAVPPVGDTSAVDAMLANRESAARKFHVNRDVVGGTSTRRAK
jgi:hypothetical protein